MSDRWAADIIEAIRDTGSKGGGLTGTQLHFATVSRANPLTLRLYDQPITKNIYINPSCLLGADDDVDRIAAAFSGAPEPHLLFSFLKDFHKRFVIRKGDEVLVMQIGSAFYVIEKVVRA